MNISADYLPHTMRTHPMEKSVLLEIQKMPLFHEIARLTGSIRMKTGSLPEMILHGYPVTERTYPRLERIYKSVLKSLDCDQRYRLFVDFSYDLQAKTYGSDKDGYMIVLSSACMDELTDEELAALLGREIGHIQEQHVQTQALLDSIHILTDKIPVMGNLTHQKLIGFFAKWMILSQFTADRYSLAASGSVETVVSLMLKQSGCQPDEELLQSILRQEVRKTPEKIGIFFLMMSKNVSSFGLVQRIQELKRWTTSQELKSFFPYIYFNAKNYFKVPPEDTAEEEQMLLHLRAKNGNPVAMSTLGYHYLSKGMGLPFMPNTATSLLKNAASLGDGAAQYYLSRCAKVGVGSIPKSAALEGHLLTSAASRIPSLKADNQEHLKSLKQIDAIVKAVKQGRQDIFFSTLAEDLSKARDGFWMMQNETIYAAELQEENGCLFGTAVSEYGIYGRLSNTLPFRILWSEWKRDALVKRPSWDADYLVSGEKKMYQCRYPLPGSLAEVLVMIKQLLEKE